MKDNFTKWILGITAAIIASFATAWIQINSRIAVLEVQVREYRTNYDCNSRKMDSMMQNIIDIKQTLISMQGDMKLKADKKLIN